jgi:sec-independent protein translocase protein TatC
LSTVGWVFDLLRGKPKQVVGPDGRMALTDHLREFRARLIRSVLLLTIAFVAMLFLYDPLLLDLIAEPYRDAIDTLGVDKDKQSELVANGISAGLMLQLKLSGVAALVVSAPYWLYQIWAFILPGLHPHERKWSRVVAAIAGPLFFGGVALGYYVLPKGLSVLIAFVPDDVQNLVDFGAYFSFVTRMLLIFGVAMEIPFFVILLNLAGVVSGRALGRHRPWIVIGVFVFAAVATPSTDPFSMLMLAIPLQILFIVAEIVARLVDRARGRGNNSTSQWGDDEVSPI